MFKRSLLLCVFLGATLILGGCQRLPDKAAPPSVPSSTLTSLYFSENGSYFKRVQGFEFRTEEGRHTAYFYMANEEEPYPVAVDQAWVDTLNGFITQYDMVGWDGFSGSATGLLDGTHFLAEFSFADGTSMRASGYGRFPVNYGDASAAIDAHFMQLLPQDMRDW